MPNVTVPQNNPNDEITAESVNQGPNAIAAVVNGNLDDDNIASLSGTKISSGTVPVSALDTNANPETRMDESLGDFVASGLVWSATSGLGGSMTSGVAYINGKRLAVSSVSSYSFTASRDTYVYVGSTGTITYDPQTNGATIPTTPADTILLAKVVTNGSAVTSVTDYRRTAPTGIWQNWTPTWVNLTVGNAVQSFRFTRIGNTVFFRGYITLGSTSSVGSGPTFTLPVPARDTAKGTASGSSPIGTVYIEDNGNSNTQGEITLSTVSTALPTVSNTSSSYLAQSSITSTVPITWGNGDEMRVYGQYEAAQ